MLLITLVLVVSDVVDQRIDWAGTKRWKTSTNFITRLFGCGGNKVTLEEVQKFQEVIFILCYMAICIAPLTGGYSEALLAW